MSVREYIGARYVPLFADPIEWDNTKTYEPLTIVYYQGNSYTSRQAVPTGIAITNDDYWALTGNYNAQIEQYRSEVEAFDGRIEDVEDSIETIDGDIDTISGDIKSLDERLDLIEANGWVTSSRISNDAVTTEKIGNNAITTNKVEDNAITTSKLNFKSLIASYRPTSFNYPNNKCIIAGSNDGVNWTTIKELTVTAFDASNILYSEVIGKYVIVCSGHVYLLDDNFDIYKDLGTDYLNPLSSSYNEVWGVNIQEIDGNLYAIAACGRNSTTYNQFNGDSISTSFVIGVMPITYNDETETFTTSTYSILTLTGYTNNNHIDPYIIKIGEYYYLACKDETDLFLEIYRSSSLTGTYSRVWYNSYLHGIEAPKLSYNEIENTLSVYFSGYDVQIIDQRTTQTVQDTSSTTWTIINKASCGVKPISPIFVGKYTINVATMETKNYWEICKFSTGIPRHMGLCVSNVYLPYLRHDCPYTFGSLLSTASEDSVFWQTINVGQTSLANKSNNYVGVIPAIGDRCICNMSGTIPATFTGKLCAGFKPCDFGRLSIPFDYKVGGADNRASGSQNVYIGGFVLATDTAIAVPAGPSIKEWQDRQIWRDLADCGINGAWYSNWRS